MPYDGLSAAQLAERLGAAQCLSLIRVTSTMDIVHELAADGAGHGTIVVADEQVAGRGRLGRTWHSPAGRGIWLGYLWRREEGEQRVETGVLSLRVGLVVVQALADLGVEGRVKWPNDVLVCDRKVAGILCEARWRGNQLGWIAVGIGMNVHGPLPPDVAMSAIALDAVAPEVARVDILERLGSGLRRCRTVPELSPVELRMYAECDWLRGKQLLAPLQGRALGVDPRGALLVETAEGVECVAGGQIVAA